MVCGLLVPSLCARAHRVCQNESHTYKATFGRLSILRSNVVDVHTVNMKGLRSNCRTRKHSKVEAMSGGAWPRRSPELFPAPRRILWIGWKTLPCCSTRPFKRPRPHPHPCSRAHPLSQAHSSSWQGHSNPGKSYTSGGTPTP